MITPEFKPQSTILMRFAMTLYLLLTAGYGHAQKSFVPSERMKTELYKAEVLLKSEKTDSSRAIAEKLLAGLSDEKQRNSYFGLRVRLVVATVYEQKNQNRQAIARLHKIIDQSNFKSGVDVYVKACLVMAMIHEKSDAKEQSLRYLKDARSALDKFKPDSLYPAYAIRMASWKRLYESNEAAIPFALQVLELSPKFSLKEEEAIGHLLMKILLLPVDPDASWQHNLKSLQIYKDLENHNGQSACYQAFAQMSLEKGELKRALIYSDSAMTSVSKSLSEGSVPNSREANIYLLRASIYKDLNKLDSALFYTDLGYKVYWEGHLERYSDNVKEMELLNETDKKDREHNAKLKQRNIILRAAGIILILTFLLVFIIYRNLKRQQQAKQALEEQNTVIRNQSEQLRKLDETKSLFYANASHELRTPLTLILEPLNTLLTNRSLGETQKYQLLSIALKGGATLKNLIDQILDLGKLDGGNMDTYLTPTRIRDFFAGWLTQFESVAGAKGLTWLIENHIPEDLVAMLDREKCRQIISNLVSNALKFTPKGGQVEVRIDYGGGQLHLCVTDTGRGIEAGDLPYLFDRYFQAGQKDELAQGGMGIGLALCHDYVKLFGGKIRVESTPGRGACFYVEFPLQTTAEIPAEEIFPAEESLTLPVPDHKKQGNKPTVLVVEDNFTLQNYLHLLLREEYHVLLAEHGEAALEKLRAYRGIDLIISDLMMPVMNGCQLLNILKSDKKTAGIPVIMLTAREEKDEKLKALRIGVDDYLTKPFGTEELKVRIANLLKRYSVRKEEDQEAKHVSEEDRGWLQKFEEASGKLLSNDHLGIPDLAAEFAMSESTLFRQLKRLTGLSPQQYIREIRLEKGRELFNDPRAYSVQQVAAILGYKDPRSFSRAFKARFGKLPSET